MRRRKTWPIIKRCMLLPQPAFPSPPCCFKVICFFVTSVSVDDFFSTQLLLLLFLSPYYSGTTFIVLSKERCMKNCTAYVVATASTWPRFHVRWSRLEKEFSFPTTEQKSSTGRITTLLLPSEEETLRSGSKNVTTLINQPDSLRTPLTYKSFLMWNASSVWTNWKWDAVS